MKNKDIRSFFNSSYMVIIIVIVLTAIGIISTICFPNDNPIEQVAEELIEIETGYKVDLSP